MLEPILKGLVEWLYEMMLDIMSYASGELLGVMSMDLTYFEKTAPVINEIVGVFIALGWALLIGNLVFQMLKSIMSGAGFEAEDPKIIFLRTFVFAFLLLASRQICEIGLGITGTVIDMLELPTSITVTTPDESMFSLAAGAKWLLVIIVGVVLMVQMVKLLFEIGERYVITSVLTFFAPLAFAMGGSRNTNDIFKGWCRMYVSMLVMMIMNIVFLKLIMSAMSQMNSGGVLIWLVFVVALTRVARKIDSHIGKIGLNPAQTGSGIGSRFPGMMTMMAVRVMSSTVSRSLAGAKGNSGKNGSSGNSRNQSSRFRGGFGGNTSNRYGGANANTSSASYAGGSANVNSSGNVNMGGGTSTVNPSYGGTHTGSQLPSSGSAPADKSSQANRPSPAGGGTNMNQTSGQNVQNNGGNMQSHQNGSTPKPGTTRPPIPRNTARATQGGVNGGTSYGSTVQNNSGVQNTNVGGNASQPHKNGTMHPQMPGTQVMQGGARMSDITNNRQTGNQSVSSTGSVQKNSAVSRSVQKGGNVSGTNMQETKFAGKSGSVNVGGANFGGTNIGGTVQNVSEHSIEHTSSERFAERNTEKSRETRNNMQKFSKATDQSSSEITERRINHEYKHGRYNPAAANKKAKKQYYRKESLQERRLNDRKRNRGENNRKRKR